MAAAPDLYPCPPGSLLRTAFVGKRLQDVPAPAAVLDKAIVERNCKQILTACRALLVDFRPHTKTHKTTEVTQLQVGQTTDAVKLVVSTVAEAEHLYGYLSSCKQVGRSVNILYGIPLAPSTVERLAHLGNKLGPKSIAVMVDHPAQLEAARTFKEAAGFPIQLFIKIDTGYHRAGLHRNDSLFKELLDNILVLEHSGFVELIGFYSHAGHSYGCDSHRAAMELLGTEIEELAATASLASDYHTTSRESHRPRNGSERTPRYILSVGATPTATSVQNWLGGAVDPEGDSCNLRMLIERCQQKCCVELHAGVYPFLDMQQLVTQASPSQATEGAQITTADVALTILAEVASIYANRTPPEALIAAGSLALGRDPCKSYSGWGVVSDWGMKPHNGQERSGWQVGRISQEHGILTEDSDAGRDGANLEVGQKVRIWPNHACIAGAMFGWYLVVDSSLPEERRDEVVDVWVRWRGW